MTWPLKYSIRVIKQLEILNLKFYSTNLVSKQKWNDTELKLLQKGVKLFGTDWDKIQEELLPNRRSIQIKDLWYKKFKKISNRSDSKISQAIDNHLSNLWSPKLDNLVKYCIENEFRDWEQIKLLHFPKLSKSEVKLRYKYLMINRSNQKWSSVETSRLIEAIEYLDDDWGLISNHVKTRSPHQCRVKFLRYLKSKPILDPPPFTGQPLLLDYNNTSKDEFLDDLIDKFVIKYGKKWNLISLKFPLNLLPSQLKYNYIKRNDK